ncbi:substrate-binding domain-containing protein [Massilia litorea]|uniref:Quinoprotein dehydrogenase-associated putative ABC transporter substrate-binding protein n=1 Tax=Massilia litorea TaxID=2769491 RepID=A0A7L9U7M3_9BURK|nr:substrate-binding domain-containing protein [Massilia litorea]QOL50056.1 quinoprotein dehydrogenase-associated putative ABC transporter substrate-binding protein [Massilia litorea]
MSSPFRKLLFAAAALALGAEAQAFEPRQLRVCADPDNLPYSNQEGAGFENKIAELIAQDLHATLEYDWWPQRRGFVRRTIGAGMCDLLIGVPADFERVATTRPYYRSAYVFVTRRADPVPDFGSPAIRERRIGVQLIGNDMAATPAGHALSRAGATANVTGFTIFGDGPAAERMVHAVDSGEIDAALLWGPQAGWFAARAQLPLKVSIARPPAGTPEPFEFDVALGVKRGNKALLAELEGVLTRRQGEIDGILAQYHVPRTDKGEGR